MKKFSIITVGLATLATTGVCLAGAAAATGGSATDTIAGLEDQGYQVHINFPRTPPTSLSQCLATGVHGVPRGVDDPDTRHNTTVYVDISCPTDNN